MSTPVEEIRRAAQLMRERATKAEQPDYGSDHPGRPWCPDWTYVAVRHVERNMDMECPMHKWDTESESECNRWGRYAGYHIASWHPGVALKIADLLDVLAHHGTGIGPQAIPLWEATKTAARAYLGGAI